MQQKHILFPFFVRSCLHWKKCIRAHAYCHFGTFVTSPNRAKKCLKILLPFSCEDQEMKKKFIDKLKLFLDNSRNSKSYFLTVQLILVSNFILSVTLVYLNILFNNHTVKTFFQRFHNSTTTTLFKQKKLHPMLWCREWKKLLKMTIAKTPDSLISKAVCKNPINFPIQCQHFFIHTFL